MRKRRPVCAFVFFLEQLGFSQRGPYTNNDSNSGSNRLFCFFVVHLDVMISAKKLANSIYLEINLAPFLNFLKTLARVCSRKTGNVLMGEIFKIFLEFRISRLFLNSGL